MANRLDQLEEIAKAATPGPWAIPVANVFRVIAPEAEHENPRMGLTPGYPWRVVADTDPFNVNDTAAAEATFIATFNPSTVLSLVETARLLEQLTDVWDQWLAALPQDENGHPSIDPNGAGEIISKLMLRFLKAPAVIEKVSVPAT